MKAFRIFIFVLIAIGVIWLLVALVGRTFSPSTPTPTTTASSLVRYANTDAEAVMLIDGPVQSDQTHQSLRLTVGRDRTLVELMNGYQGQVVKQEVFPSNSSAFAAFLKSLDKVGFNRPVLKTISADERGYCPLRSRFVYTLEENNDQKQRAWTSSCNVGNYAGEPSMTRRLFINQVPKDSFRAFLRGTGFTIQ